MSDRTTLYRLDGKRALVTGAGRGLGRAAAAALAEAGATVTLLARSAGDIEEQALLLRGRGLRAEAVALDVTDGAGMTALLAADPVFDILVNNAGTNRAKPMIEVSEEDFDVIMDLNVRAAFFVAQAFVRRLLAAGRPGAIVNISSQMGHVGWIDRVPYCTSKWAVEGMTKAMAVELAPHGIRVNAVAPTFVETPMTAHLFTDERFRATVLSKIPLGRMATSGEIGDAILFLASDAAAMITGHSLLVDGGWTAQ